MSPLNHLHTSFHQIWAVISKREDNGRFSGFLSTVSNAVVIFGIGLMGLSASMPMKVYEAYPIENTLRVAEKRPLVLVDTNGQAFAARGDCTAEAIALDTMPEHLVNALLAMEDRRFYSHIGIDPIGILRAAKRNYDAGGIRQGGSTITQQLVKFSYLSSARTLDRKTTEALLAIWLEVVLSKEQILERYLNSAYFGKGCYGVQAAAEKFFDKPASDLTLSEAAFLVALLNSPSILINDHDSATQRAGLVINAMIDEGHISADMPVTIDPVADDMAGGDENGGYYADWLAETIWTEIDAPHSRKPLIVNTTFDSSLQTLAEEAVATILDKDGKRYRAGEASLVAMRPDGRIVAMVGGRNWSQSHFNRAVQSRRQPGSAFKTFVYLAALQAGIHPDAMIVDQPVYIDGWEPANFGGNHRGYVTLTSAFALSINTVAVQISEAVGRDTVIAAARDLGIQSDLSPYASLALGTSELSLLELTSAYAAISAGAFPVKPWGVASFDDLPAENAVPPSGSGEWKLAKAREMRALMSGVVNRGSGRAARLPTRAYGKTGTSQQHRDACFVGFSGNLVVGVWVGNDDDTPMKGVTGGSLPARIWKSFMSKAIKTDRGFDRKFKQVAAFAARPRPADDTTSRLAALESLTTQIDMLGLDVSVFNHVTTGTRLHRERVRQSENRRRYSRTRRSRDFQKRLESMGWP